MNEKPVLNEPEVTTLTHDDLAAPTAFMAVPYQGD